MKETRTWGESFQEFLGEEITNAPDLEDVLSLVDAYRREDTARRQEEFERWLKDEPRTCGWCGTGIVQGRDPVREDDPMLCPSCIRSSVATRGRR